MELKLPRRRTKCEELISKYELKLIFTAILQKLKHVVYFIGPFDLNLNGSIKLNCDNKFSQNNITFFIALKNMTGKNYLKVYILN